MGHAGLCLCVVWGRGSGGMEGCGVRCHPASGFRCCWHAKDKMAAGGLE
jgi:hypothetical protein